MDEVYQVKNKNIRRCCALKKRSDQKVTRRAMAQYKIYQVEEGHLAGPPRIIDAGNDDEAATKARTLMEGCDLEIREGSRFVVAIARMPRQRAP